MRRLAVVFTLLTLALLGALPDCARASTVLSRSGNIVFVDDAQNSHQITFSGLDTMPTLAPNGHTVAFVRQTPRRAVDTATGQASANQLWIVNVDGKGARLLVDGRGNDDPKMSLAALASPAFSPDGAVIYFLSAGWATSGAIHAVSIASGKVRFVVDGNSLEVIRDGEYAGNLVVNRHKYWLAGGSYDWFWMVTPNGVEKGAVAPDEDGVREFRRLYR